VAREAAKQARQREKGASRELGGIVAVGMAAYCLLALGSYVPAQPTANLGGPVGHVLADLLMPALGRSAYLLPLFLLGAALALIRKTPLLLSPARVAAAGLLLLCVAAFFGILGEAQPVPEAGGWLGGFVAATLGDLFGSAGAMVLVTTGTLLAGLLVTGGSLSGAAAWGERAGRALGQGARRIATWAKRRVTVMRRPVAALSAAPERKPLAAAGWKPRSDSPVILLEEEASKKREPASKAVAAKQSELRFDQSYELPPLSFLDPPVKGASPIDKEALVASSHILESKLADFAIEGNVVAVRPGPVITTFEFEPAPGVKVNRIVNLADDLSMALRAMSVRILAPIPGKSVVGIEVANQRREKVLLHEILASPQFTGSDAKLLLGLGKDTTGTPVVADLTRMPHLLIAGATGTGKSVSINCMVLSILYRCSPRDVRFIMIDPKMLELSVYDGIPHQLVPVVTDPKRAAAALANVMRQMDYRYRLMRDKKVRNIDSYNRVLEREEEERRAGVIELTEPESDNDDSWVMDDAGDEAEPLVHQHLPRIVIVVDELADLMMTVGRDIEESVTRLAQKARAAGIHLILATQRPSVDVITGLIKANFPARISFQVTSRVDSRTILDTIGGERLLGEGDMLYLPPGTARVQRIHGPFVSETEIRRVVDFWKAQESPSYQMELLKDQKPEAAEGDLDDDYDEMYDQAVQLVTESRQASISWLQRRLRVGYNRAARMIERMEREGVVSRAEGARPREILAPPISDD